MPYRVLLLVDLQNNFCVDGALAVPKGDSTVDAASRLVDWCQSRGEAVIAGQDWYPTNHGSSASQHGIEPYTPGQLDGLPQAFWPDHCVQNNEGAQLHPLLNQKAIVTVFHKGEDLLVDSHSAFFDSGRRQKAFLGDWSRGHEIDELVVIGPATDHCVKFIVLGALQPGYKVNVITGGCRGVNTQSQDSTYVFMEVSAAGATLYMLTDQEEVQG